MPPRGFCGSRKCCRTIFLSVLIATLLLTMLRGLIRAPDFSVCTFIMNELDMACEEHVTLTDDGYSLFLKRIPSTLENAPTVILVHGVADTSATWVVSGRNNSLGGTLHDNGYDVWLVDRRGRAPWAHDRFTAQDSEFWDFTFDDGIEFDLPAVVEYVHRFTGQDIASLIGHAEGSLVNLAALSSNTKLASYVKSTVAFAPPIASWGETVWKMPHIPDFMDHVVHVGLVFGSIRITFNGFCDQFPSVCANAICFLGGCGNPDDLGSDVLSRVFAYYPSETSLKTMRHYAQCESHAGLETFGIDHRPYEFSGLKTPTAMFFGTSDKFVPAQSAEKARALFPKGVMEHFEMNLNFGHQDFVWSSRAKTDLYPAVLTFLKSHQM